MMDRRWIVRRIAIGCAAGLIVISFGHTAAFGQAATRPTVNRSGSADGTRVARTPWGDPDLQGTWDFTTITPLQRPAELAGKEFLTEAEAAAIQKEINQRRFDTEERTPGALSTAPPNRDDPGIYNLGWWWEPEGRKLQRSRRSSLVIDPRDGRLPALTPQAQEIFRHRESIRDRAHQPSDLPLAERCILGFNSGPPMVPGPYNNLVQLFQSPGHVVIVNEMVHDARVVTLDDRPHVGRNIQLWTGDSRGRWEGDTLVVETRNFTDNGTATFGLPGLSDRNMHLVERFTRMDDRTLIYQFTVTDPTIWTRPWTAEVSMNRIDGFVIEYACHEGNYGLANILAGARAEEQAQPRLTPAR